MRFLVFLTGLGTSMLMPPFAVASTPTTVVPWSGCAQMKISKTRTAPYGEEELKTLYCWLGLQNIDAGLEIARHYQRLTPPDYDAARKMLVDLAKGTKIDGGSIEARGSVDGGGYGTAHINADGSISAVGYRPPSPAAQRELAKFYLLGKGVDRDVPKAMDWLKKAEKGGDKEAGILRQALVAKGYAKD
jgi:Sel1 repeat